MRQLRDDTHLTLDGEVRVYRRERSKRWQAAFVIDGHTIRIRTSKKEKTCDYNDKRNEIPCISGPIPMS